MIARAQKRQDYTSDRSKFLWKSSHRDAGAVDLTAVQTSLDAQDKARATQLANLVGTAVW